MPGAGLIYLSDTLFRGVVQTHKTGTRRECETLRDRDTWQCDLLRTIAYVFGVRARSIINHMTHTRLRSAITCAILSRCHGHAVAVRKSLHILCYSILALRRMTVFALFCHSCVSDFASNHRFRLHRLHISLQRRLHTCAIKCLSVLVFSVCHL